MKSLGIFLVLLNLGCAILNGFLYVKFGNLANLFVSGFNTAVAVYVAKVMIYE